MNQRMTGVVEVFVILISMLFGAAFIFFAFELGNATRPGEMRVWGSTEGVSGSSTGSSGSTSASTPSSGSGSAVTTSATATPSASGKAVFDKNCNACHPGGGSGLGPAVNTAEMKQKYPNDSDLAAVIRNGKGSGMPAFKASALSDGDLGLLVAHIRSITASAPTAALASSTPVPTAKPETSIPSGGTTGSTNVAQPSPTTAPSSSSGGSSTSVDTASGKAAFDKSCNGCHPGAKKGFGPDVSGPAFREKYAADKDLAAVIRNGKGAMPGFKADSLAEDALTSMIAYLKSIP